MKFNWKTVLLVLALIFALGLVTISSILSIPLPVSMTDIQNIIAELYGSMTQIPS